MNEGAQLWQVFLAAVLGAALGYGGGWLAPRWLTARPPAWEVYALAGATGLCAALLALNHGLGAYFWQQLVLIAIVLLAAFVDLHDRIIPNELVLFGLGAGLLLLLVLPYPEKTWLQALGGAAAGFAFFFALATLVPGGMGMGDVKLVAVMGLFMGISWLAMSLVIAFLLGGLVSAGVLLTRRMGRKAHIPFGPFLASGAIITALYGSEIWNWYLGRI